MNITGNVQAFTLAVITFIGFFGYVLILGANGRSPDPVLLPVLVAIVGPVGAYFFSSHIANGAAAKALDVLLAARGIDNPMQKPQPDAGDIKGGKSGGEG